MEKKWGTNFVNCTALTLYHGHREKLSPMSRLFTFTDGSKQVRVQCYLHTDHFAKRGWYDEAERVIELGNPFCWE